LHLNFCKKKAYSFLGGIPLTRTLSPKGVEGNWGKPSSQRVEGNWGKNLTKKGRG